MEKIYSVDELNIAFDKKIPPNMIIAAKGSTNTGGWSNFSLTKVMHVTPPADGIQEFTFDGEPPTGAAPEVIEPGKMAWAKIEDLDQANYWGKGVPLKGIRVSAATNSKEEIL